LDDINEFRRAYPKVNFRHYVAPSKDIGSGLAILNFDNATNTWPIQQQGRADGAAAVKLEDGFYFKKMDEWNASKDLQKQFPKLADFIQFHI